MLLTSATAVVLVPLAWATQHNEQQRAEAVRRAVASFLPKGRQRKLDFRNEPAFGSWKNRDVDSVEYQRKLRAEWDNRA